MKTKLILVAIISLILVGCATSDVPKDFSLSPDSKSGVLIASLKYDGPVAGYKVYYKGLNNDQTGYFEAGSSKDPLGLFGMRHDFPDFGGKLQVTVLPPGDYEIDRWRVDGGMAHISHATPFIIKFKIEPGKATYIGSFMFTVTNKFVDIVTATKVDFSDEFDEDVKVLRRLYPSLATIDIYRGVEPGLKKENIGGAGTAYFDLAPLLLPVH